MKKLMFAVFGAALFCFGAGASPTSAAPVGPTRIDAPDSGIEQTQMTRRQRMMRNRMMRNRMMNRRMMRNRMMRRGSMRGRMMRRGSMMRGNMMSRGVARSSTGSNVSMPSRAVPQTGPGGGGGGSTGTGR